LIIGGICIRAGKKGNRVLVLCHQAEILEQNERTLKSMHAGIDTGIYCAGSGRKETDNQVIFASRDSLGINPLVCGKFDLVIVDEAHLISPVKNSRYQKIFEKIGAKFVVGLTGTPWRLGRGRIWGKGGFFEVVTHNISLDFLIADGFIVPYVFPKIESLIDVSTIKVSRATGDFDEADLERVSSTEEVVGKALDYWQTYAFDRKCSIFFCCSIAHAKLVTKLLALRIGFDQVGFIDGKTNARDRNALLDRARSGGYKALVNVGVLTTGVDIKPIDCVVGLRATQSAALFVQANGRGLRVSPGKENLLCLDMAGNFQRFHNLSEPLLQKDSSLKNGDDEPTLGGTAFDMPKKICPECAYDCQIATKVCPYCEHIFITHSIVAYGKCGLEDGRREVQNYHIIYSKTSSGESCAIVSFKLKGIKKNIKEWLLYKRLDGLGNQARAKINILTSRKITEVYASGLNDNFPRLKYIKTEALTESLDVKREDRGFVWKA